MYHVQSINPMFNSATGLQSDNTEEGHVQRLAHYVSQTMILRNIGIVIIELFFLIIQTQHGRHRG